MSLLSAVALVTLALAPVCGGCSSSSAPAAGHPDPTAAAGAQTISPAGQSTPEQPRGPLDDGRTILGIEGDSISVDYVGYYAGYFKQQHPSIEVHNQAAGASSVALMLQRRDRLIASNPDIVTVFIGANDLGGSPSAKAFAESLLAYAEPLRARGTKVLVATNLAISNPANTLYAGKHNRLRDEVAILLKSSVGKRIDGLIDFAADPVVGRVAAPANPQLFSDGVHPTEIGYRGSKGGHDYLYEVYRRAVEPLLPRK